MSRRMQWICLLAGFVLFLVGVRNVYQKHDAVILIISILIICFTMARMIKTRQGK